MNAAKLSTWRNHATLLRTGAVKAYDSMTAGGASAAMVQAAYDVRVAAIELEVVIDRERDPYPHHETATAKGGA